MSNRKGVVLGRTRWLRGIATEFVKRGGTLKTNSDVLSINKNFVFLGNGEKIKYDTLIGADGPFSVVGRHMGIKQKVVCGV
ncbi:MAG: hypothetical protein U9O96_06755 [Candidatus Thermoplasmatota archaeon]|nr:hypothetical protein [Candidatus Thermoplasmatota archaeon]